MASVHATCIAIDGHGVLLRGPSGCGKSDLALRLIDRGARLVADDRVVLTVEDGAVVAAAPPPLAGLLEVRGLGPLPVPTLAAAPVALVCDLVPAAAVERLPAPQATADYGPPLPLIRLSPFHASAPSALRLAVSALAGSGSGDAAGAMEKSPDAAALGWFATPGGLARGTGR